MEPPRLSSGFPETGLCQLFCVSQDVLRKGSALEKNILKSIVSILNKEILKLADSPSFHIFVLLPPFKRNSDSLDVLCAIVAHIDSNLPSNYVKYAPELTARKCFNGCNVEAKDVSGLSGLHIIHMATHPRCRRMGYGLRAVQLLKELYEGKMISLGEDPFSTMTTQDDSSSPLLQLSDLKLAKIDYICVFFDLAEDVFSFWKKAEFVPLRMVTGKDSDTVACVMFKALNEESSSYVERHLPSFINSFYFHCKNFPAYLALSVLNSCRRFMSSKDLPEEKVGVYFKPYHMKLLEMYCVRLHDLHTVIHIIPTIAKLYFKNLLKSVHLSEAQEAILLSYGIQFKPIDSISRDLHLQSIQVVGLLNRTLKKVTAYINNIIERSIESALITTDIEMKPLEKDLDEELEEAGIEVQKQQEKLLDLDVSQYAIKGCEDDWQKALFSGRKTLVSIKSIKNKIENRNPSKTESGNKFKKQFRKKKH